MSNYPKPKIHRERVQLEYIYKKHIPGVRNPEEETPIADAFNAMTDAEPFTEVDLIRTRQKIKGNATPFPGSK